MTVVALAVLIRLRVGLNYSPENLRLMLAIYGLAALPFFAGGSVISLAISRYAARVNIVYAADLIGAALGCLLLIPLLNTVGAPGSVLVAALIGSVGALLLLDGSDRRRWLLPALIVGALPLTLHLAGFQFFEVRVTKGHDNDRLLFSRWNSFSRVAVYDRDAWRLVAEPALHGARARLEVHGHRLSGLDADRPLLGPARRRLVAALRTHRARVSTRA